MGANPKRAEEIQQRLINFSARTTRVAKMLPRTEEGRYIAKQLLRSGLAAGSNYAEARAAESRADFIHKLRIVLKELNETTARLEQIVANGLFSRDKWRQLWRKTRNFAGSSLHPLRRRADQAVQFEIFDFGHEGQRMQARQGAAIKNLRCRIRPISKSPILFLT